MALTAFTGHRRPHTVPLSSVGVAPVPANDVVHTVEPFVAQAAQLGVGGHHEDPTVVDDGLRPGDALPGADQIGARRLIEDFVITVSFRA